MPVLQVAVLGVALLAAQSQTSPAGEVEVSPINCGWRTSKSAVEVGERFTVTVTCSVVETERNTVVVDPNQLDPAALALAPFEVVSGRRHEDVVEFPMRHFQHEFVVRILANPPFGQDVDLPPLPIKYTIRSTIGGTEGRELSYVLPALPIRVLSLVSSKAADIRDSSGEAFRDLEARRRRANNELAIAAVAFGFAVVLVGLAAAQMVGRYRVRKPASERVLAPSQLVRASLQDLEHVNGEVASGGWTLDRAARALAALRVAAAVGLGKTVAQTRVEADAVTREGQVLARGGLVGSHRAMVSAATSSVAIEKQVATSKAAARLAGPLNELGESIRVFTSSRYGRRDTLDQSALNSALEKGMHAARQVRAARRWTLGTLGTLWTR